MGKDEVCDRKLVAQVGKFFRHRTSLDRAARLGTAANNNPAPVKDARRPSVGRGARRRAVRLDPNQDGL